MELLNLQSSLQSEIQAKQSIGEELSKTRSELIAMQKYDLSLLYKSYSACLTQCVIITKNYL